MKTKTWSILLIGCLLFLPILSKAQTGQHATLTSPQAENFPEMSTFLDVYDSAGRFLFGVTSEEITLTENGNPCPIQKFEELSPGVQVVAAFNMGAGFAIRDELGVSRFEYLSQALIHWGENLSAENLDDLSLITNDGIERTHLNDPAIWTSALESYQPQPRETPSNFNVLAHAIDIASDPAPHQAMKKVVLLLTPPPTPEEIVAIQSLTAYAQERGVRLFAWVVSSPAYFNSPGVEQLRQSAAETGGAFFAFSGEEAIPSPESYFSPLRGTYALTYQSQITTSGPHTLEAAITTKTGEIMARREFPLDIQPPNPIFVSPPLEITRENPNPEEENAETKTYTPTTRTLDIIIEFPDGHPRPLAETILYVDGNEEAKNTSPPFDQFTWDLSQYEDSQTHHLQIQAVDSLGLSQSSLETPIQVTIDKPEPKMGELLGCIIGEQPLAIAGLGAIIMAAILLLVCLRRGLIHPKAFLRVSKASQRTKETAPESQEEQPRRTSFRRENISSWINRLPWPEGEEAAKQAQAVLEPITKRARKLFPEQIPLYDAEMTFGKDASAATILIKEASLNDLHARLELISENAYQLSDEGSVAGTWVNYQPINGESRLLQHGDILHLGRVGFLFRIQDASTHPEVFITPQEDKNDHLPTSPPPPRRHYPPGDERKK